MIKRLILGVALLLLLVPTLSKAQDVAITTAIVDSAATFRSVKVEDAAYETARNSAIAEAVAAELAIFNSDTTAIDFRVSRGFVMFDLSSFAPAVSVVDSARLYLHLRGVIDFTDADTTYVVEGTYAGGYVASDSVDVAWFNDFTGWVDISAGPVDSTYSGVIEYTAPFIQTSASPTTTYSQLFTQVGLDSLAAKLGSDTLRMTLLNGQDIANFEPDAATQGLTSWATNSAATIPYIVVYYRAVALDTAIAAVSGGLTLVADTTLDWQVRDSTCSNAFDASTMNIGYWQPGGNYSVGRTALTFATDQLELADSIISATLYFYPTSVTDSLDVMVAEGTFSGTADSTWFNDFTGWTDGAPHTITELSDSLRVATGDVDSWVSVDFTATGKAKLLTAMGTDSLRIMLLGADDVYRLNLPTEDTYHGAISATNLPYLSIAYETLVPPAVITNLDIDTLKTLGSWVYDVFGGRIDSVGDGLDSVGVRYFIKGNAADSAFVVSDSTSATWETDSFRLTITTADTLEIDTVYVVTAFAVNGAHRFYSAVNDTVSTDWSIPTTWVTMSTLVDDSTRANPVRDIWNDATGNVWLGTAMGLYHQAADDSISHYIYDDTTYIQKSRNNVLAGAGTPDSTIYTGSLLGLTRHDTLSFTDDSLITESTIPDSVIWVIEADSGSANQVWIGGTGGYLCLFSDTVDAEYDTSDGLAGQRIFDIVIDSTYSVWIATENGVSRLISTYWITYTTVNSELKGNLIQAMAIAGNDSSIWFGGDEGLVQFDGDTTWTDWTDSLPVYEVNSLAYNPVTLTMWIGTDSGLVAYQEEIPSGGSSWREYFPASTGDSLPGYEIFSVQADSAGRVWVGHSTGVARLKETF